MPSSRGSSQLRDWTCCCRQILYQLSHQGSPRILELGVCMCVWLLLLLSHSGVSICDPMCYQAKLDVVCRGEVCVCVCCSVRGSSWPSNWTGVSCMAGRFFTSWATREALLGKIQFHESCLMFNKVVLYSSQRWLHHICLENRLETSEKKLPSEASST